MNDTETLKKGKIVGVVFGILLAISAIITIIVGIIFTRISADYSDLTAKQKETFVPTKATVVTIVRVKDSMSGRHTSYHHDVNIEYSVDGKTYNNKLNYYDSDIYEGRQVTILYNPENPEEIIYGELTDTFTSSFTIIGIGIIVVGALTFVVGIVIAVKCKKSYNELKNAM